MSPQLSPGKVMLYTACVLVVLGIAWILIHIRAIILLFVLGILFAAAIEPLVFRLRKRGMKRGQAILTVYVGLIFGLGLVLYLIVPPLVNQGTLLVDDIPEILMDLRDQAAGSNNEFIRTTGTRTMTRAINAYDDFRNSPNIEGSQALEYATSAVGVIFTIVSTMVVAFYWMTEKAIIKRLVLGLVPLEKRDRAHSLWDEIEYKIGGWTRGQLFLCLVIGVLSATGYFLIGLDFWLALGIFAGITEIIPFFGPIIGGTAAVTIALTISWEKALIVLVFVIALQQLESVFLVPRVMRNAVGMTPLTVILAVLIGGALYGPLGSILAIPIGAAVQVFVQDLLHARADDPDSIIREAQFASAAEEFGEGTTSAGRTELPEAR
jgi:predicted PurR-regulated permease PerM